MARIKKRKPKKNDEESRDSYVRKKRSKQTRQIVLTVILAGVMILSVFGIMFSSYNSQESKEDYNGFEFVRVGVVWKTELNGEVMEFQYLPSQLESLQLSPDVISLLQAPVIAVTFDPDSKNIELIETARLKLAQTMALNLGNSMIYGITKESSIYDLPVFTCENSTDQVPVIKLVEAEDGMPETTDGTIPATVTEVYAEGNCIIVSARGRDWEPVVERLLYAAAGIMQ